MADLPVVSLRKLGFSLSPFTNGDSSVNQDVLLIDFFLPVVLL